MLENSTKNLRTVERSNDVTEGVDDLMIIVQLEVKPIPQPRPKARRLGNKAIQIYTPNSTAIKEYKGLIARAVQEKLPEGWKRDGFVAMVDLNFFLSSTTNPCQLDDSNIGHQRNSFFRSHSSKPDVDNLTKPILDALNGIVWDDDGQVAHLNVGKYYCPVKEVTKRGKRIFTEPRINIVISFESLT